MRGFKYSVSGDFKRTFRFLEGVRKLRIESILAPYGEEGCRILSAATPVRTGETAAAWSYEIKVTREQVTLTWLNSSLADDNKTPVVILIIKGHGTGTGGYVPPNDFVTPLMEPLCAEAADAVWKVVTSL